MKKNRSSKTSGKKKKKSESHQVTFHFIHPLVFQLSRTIGNGNSEVRNQENSGKNGLFKHAAPLLDLHLTATRLILF